MKIDHHVRNIQKGNWVWVHTANKKFAGWIVGVIRRCPEDNEYIVELKDGTHVSALQREVRRCRPPKRIRNADWLRKRVIL